MASQGSGILARPLGGEADHQFALAYAPSTAMREWAETLVFVGPERNLLFCKGLFQGCVVNTEELVTTTAIMLSGLIALMTTSR